MIGVRSKIVDKRCVRCFWRCWGYKEKMLVWAAKFRNTGSNNWYNQTLPKRELRTEHSELNIALCSKGWHFWKGGFVTNKTGLKISVFVNAMIFAFATFVTNTPLYGKIASKVWKIYFQIYHLIFCMLQAAKYLIYDYFYFLILLFFLP